MKILGIDLSSMKEGTSACFIDYDEEVGSCRPPFQRCCEGTLDGLIIEADAVGIDAPLGWPKKFSRSVSDWHYEEWDECLRDQMRFRETDRAVRRLVGKWPLSVSSDRIALPAMRAMSLLNRHGVQDKSGGDKGFYEVYPAASLFVWDLYEKGYKKTLDTRRRILANIRNRFPLVAIADEFALTHDNLDSLVAALTTREAVLGNTIDATEAQRILAVEEGWIHIPR